MKVNRSATSFLCLPKSGFLILWFLAVAKWIKWLNSWSPDVNLPKTQSVWSKGVPNLTEKVKTYLKITATISNSKFCAEFQKIAIATAIGFCIMGFIGFFVKLIHIPINNIIVGS